MYKPREGKINANLDKFSKESVEYVYNHAKDLIIKFGYEGNFTGVPQENPRKFIDEFNAQSLKQAI